LRPCIPSLPPLASVSPSSGTSAKWTILVYPALEPQRYRMIRSLHQLSRRSSIFHVQSDIAAPNPLQHSPLFRYPYPLKSTFSQFISSLIARDPVPPLRLTTAVVNTETMDINYLVCFTFYNATILAVRPSFLAAGTVFLRILRTEPIRDIYGYCLFS
jgi:hypothetical protein